MFALVKNIFLRNRSLVTLDDFGLKKAKLEREICISLKNDLVETKFAVRKMTTII